MNRIIIILAFVGLLTPAKLNAQKVYLEGTKVVLDLTASTGMPAGAVTSVKKTWPTTGSNTAGPIANNVVSQTINATVYQKIEVAPYDLNSAMAISPSGTLQMDWATAFNYCRSANYNGTGWRLPTQRELQLMRIFRPALEDLIVNNLGGVAFAVENYWTATEVNTTTAWAVHLDTSLTNSAPKTSGYHARCVRDM